MDFGEEKNIVNATGQVIHNYVLPLQPQLISWQKWREQELWTADVNDLLEINIRFLRKLYDKIVVSKVPTSKFNRVVDVNPTMVSVDQARHVLGSGVIPDVDDRLVTKAFYLSKMTVVNENESSNYEYTYLHFAEFIEMIGRIA